MSGIFRFTGAIAALSPADRAALYCRAGAADIDVVRCATTAVIARVRDAGDSALAELARELDGVTLPSIEIPRERWRAALSTIPPALRLAMERSARNLRAAHGAFLPEAMEIETEPGVMVGRRPDPIGRVGVYAPGGRATYPSSLLMGAIPARVAGVGEVIVCSPPTQPGEPAPVILAAAELAGVDRVFAVGGAGAIAAMAYGTRTIPRVDRIVGPGNAYVAEAKLQVASVVGIDSPAGPSELLVVADRAADPEIVAREVMAQAEHDPQAAVVVVAIGAAVARRIANAIETLAVAQPRHVIIAESLATRGALLVAQSVDEAIALVNEWAPEHLLLAIADPAGAFAGVRNVGTVFFGETSSVVFGDYLTGANHVLPTGGLARSYSGLSTMDFVRWTTYQRVDRVAAGRLAADAAAFATAEHLPAHAAAAAAWGDT
ncbi:MAG TPA: histidinol dehydrogenase [Gemmatimonadaceae bacterium]|nr:histidinol dehydrogenase [Gemmatimonadaceae bacterium]